VDLASRASMLRTGGGVKKILFVAEVICWSSVVRLLVLARGLDPRSYEVHFASAHFDERLFQGTSFTRWPIVSISLEKFYAAVASGKRMYNKATLKKYVADELRLYESIRPDLVVSDMRWSTPISAPAFGVPCATLVNAFWSRRTTREQFPVPDHPIFRLLPSKVVKYVAPIVLPIGLRYFAAPVNELRRKHGLPEFGDFIDVTTWGDRVLFPDDPLLTPLTHQAPHETFLGPVLWSPQTPLPPFWDELGRDRPMVYATLGSSGTVKAVPAVLEALGGMDVDVLLSTAGRVVLKNFQGNVHVVDMIPGDLAARKASVVVCNGGAGTGYQALAEGTPIVGIPSNPDQFLAAIAMRDASAGLLLRASTITPAQVRVAIEHVMREESFTQAAQRVAKSFSRFDPHARFRAVVDEVTAGGEPCAVQSH
jgi:UDP:flavonoid glycosyltransferase YjiC (YdhE family)